MQRDRQLIDQITQRGEIARALERPNHVQMHIGRSQSCEAGAHGGMALDVCNIWDLHAKRPKDRGGFG
jgi:hypothetical protein